MYFVIRVYKLNGEFRHSIEEKSTFQEAQGRFFNVLASDTLNESVDYCMAMIVNPMGSAVKSENPKPITETENEE